MMESVLKHKVYMAVSSLKFGLKNKQAGSSPEVQWLGPGAFTAVARVQFLLGKLRSCKPRSMANK